jgi:hypothetical protein
LTERWVPTGHEFEEGAKSPLEPERPRRSKRLLDKVLGRRSAARHKLELRPGVGEARSVLTPRAGSSAGIETVGTAPAPTPIDLTTELSQGERPDQGRVAEPSTTAPASSLTPDEYRSLQTYARMVDQAVQLAGEGRAEEASIDVARARRIASTLPAGVELGGYPSKLDDCERRLRAIPGPPFSPQSPPRRRRQTTVRPGVAPEIGPRPLADEDPDGRVGEWERGLDARGQHRKIGPTQNYGDST